MDLRDSLEEFGRMKGANKDEKGKLLNGQLVMFCYDFRS